MFYRDYNDRGPILEAMDFTDYSESRKLQTFLDAIQAGGNYDDAEDVATGLRVRGAWDWLHSRYQK